MIWDFMIILKATHTPRRQNFQGILKVNSPNIIKTIFKTVLQKRFYF